MITKAQIEVDIGELHALIEWHHSLACSIKPETYSRVNKAGTTMGEVALKHNLRAEELRNVLDETWPK